MQLTHMAGQGYGQMSDNFRDESGRFTGIAVSVNQW